MHAHYDQGRYKTYWQVQRSLPFNGLGRQSNPGMQPLRLFVQSKPKR